MTDQELVAYYVNLLIMQYRVAARAQATVGAFVNQIVANQIVQQVEDAFDPATAIGAQIDALGTYVGAQRRQFGLNLGKDFFSMPLVSDDTTAFKGFALCDDAATVDWFFELASDYTAASELNDVDLRAFTLYLAKLNSLDLTLANVDAFLFEFFGNYVTLTDNGNMTITVHHDSTDPNDLFAIVAYTDSLPRPAGVGISVT